MFDLFYGSLDTVIQSPEESESSLRNNSVPISGFLTPFDLLCTFKREEEDEVRILPLPN